MSIRSVCSPLWKSLKWICAAFVLLNVMLSSTRYTKPGTFFPRKSLLVNVNRSEVEGVAICAIQKNGKKYLEEWIDYYRVIGINKIYLYDNSPDHELKEWIYNPSDILEIRHFPGEAQQKPAYDHCARKIKAERLYEWVAFFDLDEFLVLKNHSSIQEMILAVTQGFEPENLSGLAINWLIFDHNNHLHYQPLPVSQRFQRREVAVNMHVKTIVYIENYAGYINPHAFLYSRKDLFAFDTTGKRLNESPWFNPDGPSDIAVLYHYSIKSIDEYHSRCERGRADASREQERSWDLPLYCQNTTEIIKHFESNVTAMEFDDTVWRILKNRLPQKYNSSSIVQ
jgi:hypothetical protein